MFDISPSIKTSITSDLVKEIFSKTITAQAWHKWSWQFWYQFVFDGGTASWKPARSLLLPLILLQKVLTLITKWYCWLHSAFPNEFILKSMVVSSWSLCGLCLWLVSVIITNNLHSNPAHSGWFLNVCSFWLFGPKIPRNWDYATLTYDSS